MVTGIATTTASPAARRSVRSRMSALTDEGVTPRPSCNPATPPSCNSLMCGRLTPEEALNLFHRVINLDVELHLAERSRGTARVPGDAVVLARWRIWILRLPASLAA